MSNVLIADIFGRSGTSVVLKRNTKIVSTNKKYYIYQYKMGYNLEYNLNGAVMLPKSTNLNHLKVFKILWIKASSIPPEPFQKLQTSHSLQVPMPIHVPAHTHTHTHTSPLFKEHSDRGPAAWRCRQRIMPAVSAR